MDHAEDPDSHDAGWQTRANIGSEKPHLNSQFSTGVVGGPALF
jgi:hypothetical protein